MKALDKIRLWWIRLDNEDKLAITCTIIALSLLIRPLRLTIIYICFIYLAIYFIISLYNHSKKKK